MGGIFQEKCIVDVVLFDFGGVLAEEGFKNGLQAIARLNGLDEEAFFGTARRAVHTSGYVMGKAPESAYWEALRKETGIRGEDKFLRNEILSRFILREWMLDLVKKLRNAGVRVGILSDQTNWLDELNARYDFFRWFDFVFNSYHMGKSKADPGQFADVVRTLGIGAHMALFIDDDPGNCERAGKAGLKVIHYIDRDQFLRQMAGYCPAIVQDLFSER